MKYLAIIAIFLLLTGFNASLVANTTEEGRKSIMEELIERYKKEKKEMLANYLQLLDSFSDGVCFSKSIAMVMALRLKGYHADLIKYKAHFWVRSKEFGEFETYAKGNCYGNILTLRGVPVPDMYDKYKELFVADGLHLYNLIKIQESGNSPPKKAVNMTTLNAIRKEVLFIGNLLSIEKKASYYLLFDSLATIHSLAHDCPDEELKLVIEDKLVNKTTAFGGFLHREGVTPYTLKLFEEVKDVFYQCVDFNANGRHGVIDRIIQKEIMFRTAV